MKRVGKQIIPYVKKKYGASEQMRYVYGTALVPIGYLKHRPPSFKRLVVCKYTPEDRANIHRELSRINTAILTYLMRNPVGGKSIEYNDNRLSLYCAQMGKCAITGLPLSIGFLHCHHIKTLKSGGDDSYTNMILVNILVHPLIHATIPETISSLLSKLSLNDKPIAKLNEFRLLAETSEIT